MQRIRQFVGSAAVRVAMVTELAVGVVAALSFAFEATAWEALVIMLVVPPFATGGYVAFEESRQRKRERPGPMYAGWLVGDRRELTADDILSASSSDSDYVTLPHVSESGYPFVAVPESIAEKVAGIRIGNGIMSQPWPRQSSVPIVEEIPYAVFLFPNTQRDVLSEEEVLVWRYGERSTGPPVV